MFEVQQKIRQIHRILQFRKDKLVEWSPKVEIVLQVLIFLILEKITSRDLSFEKLREWREYQNRVSELSLIKAINLQSSDKFT